MKRISYETRGGIRIEREVASREYQSADTALADALDEKRGVLFSSSFEFPGRYTRWDMGFVDPPLVLTARDRSFTVEPLNERGRVLVRPIAEALGRLPELRLTAEADDRISGEIAEAKTRFPEEYRSRQPSVFSVLRPLNELFASPEDEHLGLYGAFGYDLAFQFEPSKLKLARPGDQRDLVLYLPDELLVVDHRKERAVRYTYDYEFRGASTKGLPHEGQSVPYSPEGAVSAGSDHVPGEYAAFTNSESEATRRAVIERSPADQRARLEAATPLGMIEMIRAVAPGQDLGKYLRSLDAVVLINGIVFVHGGISPAVAPMTCTEINDTVRRELGPDLEKTRAKPAESLTTREDGPLWYRGLANEPDTFAPEVKKILAAQHARAIVAGHSANPGPIRDRFDQTVFLIDTGMQPAYLPDGRASALEIRGDVFTAIYDGSRQVIAGGNGLSGGVR